MTFCIQSFLSCAFCSYSLQIFPSLYIFFSDSVSLFQIDNASYFPWEGDGCRLRATCFDSDWHMSALKMTCFIKLTSKFRLTNLKPEMCSKWQLNYCNVVKVIQATVKHGCLELSFVIDLLLPNVTVFPWSVSLKYVFQATYKNVTQGQHIFNPAKK